MDGDSSGVLGGGRSSAQGRFATGAGGRDVKALIERGERGQFDFAFIDADKAGYGTYYEYCLELIRPGGLIALENVLRHGRVVEEGAQDENTVTMRALNRKLHTDERVDISLVPIADGLTLARKR